jgi:hypothetical protein
MDEDSLKILLGSFAEQQFMFSLLIKVLEEKKVLNPGEFTQRYSEKDKYQFSHDLLDDLVSRGLKIDGGLPSASRPEPLSSSQAEGKEVTDPASGKKS